MDISDKTQLTKRWILYFTKYDIVCVDNTHDIPPDFQKQSFNIINPTDNTHITVIVIDEICIHYDNMKSHAERLEAIIASPFMVVARPLYPCSHSYNDCSSFVEGFNKWDDVKLHDVYPIIGIMNNVEYRGRRKKPYMMKSVVQLVKPCENKLNLNYCMV
jgi:hypothetical protein